jgi:hypothetical protein
MQYSPYDPWRKYTSPPLDPLSTTAAALATLGGGSAATGGAMALTGIGTGISAANTIAGGDYAAQMGRAKQAEANFEADQDVANAAGECSRGGACDGGSQGHRPHAQTAVETTASIRRGLRHRPSNR